MAKKKKSAGGKRYASVSMPEPDGHPTYHRPRRNYWGNLFDDDTYKEEYRTPDRYDFSDFDPEDDHSSYYDSDGYD